MDRDGMLALSATVMAAGTAMARAVQDGVERRGYSDVRPAHGFTFALLARGPAPIAAIAEHLGVTKQAAAQLVDELEAKGYLRRRPNPDDGRSWLVELTARGRACTRAADAAALDEVRAWETRLGERATRQLATALAALAPAGPLRPAW
jgi:DNA-binding MarR family transcriptional regulator